MNTPYLKRHNREENNLDEMKKYFLTLFGLLLAAGGIQASLLEDLQTHVHMMQDGDQLTLSYTFEGCFGPYHHGEIEMEMKGGTIHYKNHSYANKKTEAFTQSGNYTKRTLISKLESAAQNASKTIYGNRINYRIDDGHKASQGSDSIEHSEFVKIFHPYQTFLKDQDEMVIPGLSTGGFVK